MFSQLGNLVVTVEHGNIRQVSFKGECSQCFGVFADRSTAGKVLPSQVLRAEGMGRDTCVRTRRIGGEPSAVPWWLRR